MTCIVGLVADGNVYIGGDSAGVGGWDLTIRADSKVFERDGYVFGFTSSFRMGQLLRYDLTLPELPAADADLFGFMVRHFIGAVRTGMKDGGYAKVENGREEGGAFLVGCRGRLFAIDDDFQVGEAICGFDAVGSGAATARGAMTALADLPPHKRIGRALEIAEQWNAGVRGPFRIAVV